MENKLFSRNVRIDGMRTSLRLEEGIWDALAEICRREGLDLNELCTMIDRRRGPSSRTSAVRAFAVTYFRAVASRRPDPAANGVAADGSPAEPVPVGTKRRAAVDAERLGRPELMRAVRSVLGRATGI